MKKEKKGKDKHSRAGATVEYNNRAVMGHPGARVYAKQREKRGANVDKRLKDEDKEHDAD